MSILSLHHITIVSASAHRAADFYTGVLGLRLVTKTVNFDAPSAYHGGALKPIAVAPWKVTAGKVTAGG